MSNPPWFQFLIWLDYRLAVIFTVIIPMVLLIWGLVKKVPVVTALMTIYWRVASLLGITVYLAIGGTGLSFFTGWVARLLIVVALWFWIDINEEIADLPPKAIKLLLTAWRWAITTYCGIGLVASLPFFRCGLSATLIRTDYCQAWFQPPLLYRQFFHGGTEPATLSGFGIAATLIYGIYFGYFLVVRLGKQGRIAMES